MAKIMIVDDMIVIQEILKEILNLKGHTIIFTALDGQQAVDYFKDPVNERPEIVIMDHRMPIKDGVTALEELLVLDENIKVIFVSADESARNKALVMGAIGYLVKPFSVKAILKLIDSVIKEN
ncbi:MAG: response regulator [Candidatus Heimdallarchaeota archaeon]|nr:MAG: response regulator [Candidatus Heimdallarchaeota archaeon]